MAAKKKAGLLLFPGTNCDRDLEMILKEDYSFEVETLWHTSQFSIEHDIYFLPGGFSYGDYLRSGALAAQTAGIKSLKEAAAKEIPILGICNGFQVLTETHLLPGALIRNKTLKHICKWTPLEGDGPLKEKISGEFTLPVSHSDGNYLANEETLKELNGEGRVILRYKEDINGSTQRIAGITSSNRRVVGLMPHPERACRSAVDRKPETHHMGRRFFDSIFEFMQL